MSHLRELSPLGAAIDDLEQQQRPYTPAETFSRAVFGQELPELGEPDLLWLADRTIELTLAITGTRTTRARWIKLYAISIQTQAYAHGVDMAAIAAKDDLTPQQVRTAVTGYVDRAFTLWRKGELPTPIELLQSSPRSSTWSSQTEWHQYAPQAKTPEFTRLPSAAPTLTPPRQAPNKASPLNKPSQAPDPELLTFTTIKSLLPLDKERLEYDDHYELVRWISAAALAGSIARGEKDNSQAISEKELVALQQLGRLAHEKLIRNFSGLVYNTAREFAHRSQTSMDQLMSMAHVGLIKAIAHWDYHSDSHLPQYARLRMRGEIKNGLAAERLIRAQRNVRDKLPQFWRQLSRLSEELERPPTDEELQAVLGCTDQELRDLKEANQALNYRHIEGMQYPHRDDPNASFLDSLEAPPLLERSPKNTKARAIEGLFTTAQLTPGEIRVICLRYGVAPPGGGLAYGPLPPAAAAAELHMGAGNLYTAEKSGLAKLRAVVEDTEDYESFLKMFSQ